MSSKIMAQQTFTRTEHGMLRLWRTFALTTFALALAMSPTRAQTLLNGDLTGPPGFDILPPGWDHAPASSNTFLPLTNYFFQILWEPSANGGTLVHSTGIDNMNLQSEGVSTVVTGLIPGASYTVTFEQSTSFFSGFSLDTFGYWDVSFGGQSQPSTLMPHPTVGNTMPWLAQSMQFTATATSEVLRFAAATVNGTPTNFLSSCMGLDGVAICQTGTCGAPDHWLYTVTNANELAVVGVDSGCAAATLGVTRDSPTGPIRRLRGLAFVNTMNSLYGITREGDLVRVNRFTGKTSLALQLPFGDPTTEFWGGLAFDGVDTLYTANAFDGLELVAIKVSALTATVIGSTLTSGGTPHQILGLDFYPATAPPSGLPNPVPGLLYGSSRNTQGLVAIDPNTAQVSPVGGNLGVAAPQAVAFHPLGGVLYSLDDHPQAGGTAAALATYDFSAFQGTELCALPFGIVEPTTWPAFGWGGLAFVRAGGWSNEGCSLAGVSGFPILVGTGSLLPAAPNPVGLSSAAPSATAALIIGLSSMPVPIFGGVLKPTPTLPVPAITSPAGTYDIVLTLPPGVPLGTQLWMQWLIVDNVAPFGVSMSNAIVGVTP